MQDFLNHGLQVWQYNVVMAHANPRRLDKQGDTPGISCRLGILPFVTNHVRFAQIQVIFERRLCQQAWLWLAAWAEITTVMRTHKNVVNRQRFAQTGMHPIQLRSQQKTAGKTRLIRRGNQQKTSGLELIQWLKGIEVWLKLFFN